MGEETKKKRCRLEGDEIICEDKAEEKPKKAQAKCESFVDPHTKERIEVCNKDGKKTARKIAEFSPSEE